MYRIITLFLLLSLSASAQNERLEIHHINIGNGDATMIVIHDINAGTYPVKVLIDGGNSNTSRYLAPYFQNYFGAVNIPVKFDYVILSHFHADHYRGLSDIANGVFFKTKYIIDPGGYDLGAKYAAINPGDKTPNRGSKAVYTNWLKTGFDKKNIELRNKRINTFPGDITNGIEIGKVNNEPVNIYCIAGAGYTNTNNGVVYSNTANLKNPNNYTLAFIIEYGEFRYFTGGDMGGDAGCSAYINQESALTTGIKAKYPASSYPFDKKAISNEVKGHICAFKVNHHGSACSSNKTFLKFAPAAIFVSSGKQPSWGLPKPVFQNRVQKECLPLSCWSDINIAPGVNNQGIYFTNLFNFILKKKSVPCRSTAIDLFYIPGDSIMFRYGNNYDKKGTQGGPGNWHQSDKDKDKDSYVLVVNPANITTQSSFEIFQVNYNKNPVQKSVGTFTCHRDTKP